MGAVTVFVPPYPKKFKSGDIAIARHSINFCDGTNHVRGQRIKVTARTEAYYNVCHKNYDKDSK